MAQMIPPVIPGEYRGEGERELFRRLRDDPTTREWYVFHSLGLAKHERRVAGEIDFVIIIPARGIVCLEVKGCSNAHLRRESGVWFYGPDDKGDSRGPFRQASEAMHSLRRYLLASDPSLGSVLFSSGVAFPFAEFRVQSPEWNEWEVIDSRALRSGSLGKLLIHLTEATRDYLKRAPSGPRIDAGAPTPHQYLAIRDALRADFEIPADAKARLGVLEDELRRYTAEQILALDAMSDNPRVIFAGPAGTGKTLLAMEAARRAHAAGRRVLLVCFNRLLGTWLEREMTALAPTVATCTLHKRMLAVADLEHAPRHSESRFWEEALPSQACSRLADEMARGDRTTVVDELIVDEAQDLLRKPYFDFLDLGLGGGLAAGRWRIFGDFENQAIYGSTTSSLDEFRRSRATDAPIFRFRVNCRNTPLVAEWIHLLCGLNPPYSRVLRPDDGVQPEIRFYGDQSQQHTILVFTLQRLEQEGFAPADIVVLSTRAERACAAGTLLARPWKDRLAALSQPLLGRIRYGSIRVFKGLESRAVVVTDVETISTPEASALLYVALTRALQRIVILAYERVRSEAVASLKERNPGRRPAVGGRYAHAQ